MDGPLKVKCLKSVVNFCSIFCYSLDVGLITKNGQQFLDFVTFEEEGNLNFDDIFMEQSSPYSEMNVHCEDCLAVFLSPTDYENHECANAKLEKNDDKNLIQYAQTVGFKYSLNRVQYTH